MMVEPLQVFNFIMFIVGSGFVIVSVNKRNYCLFVGVALYLLSRLVFFVFLFYTRLILQVSSPTEIMTFISSVSSSIEAAVFAMYAIYFYKRGKYP